MEKKYIIYKNDLKYREDRNIDINKIDWNQNDIKHLMKTDHDTLEYRLNESKNTNYNDLDLEMLKLNDLPTILKINIFINLKHLFISNNNLTGYIDLSFLKNLETLDITNNNINKIIIPNNLIELSACNNSITNFTSSEKLKRLKISNNKITELYIPNTIEILEVNNNLITSYDFSNYDKLNRIIIFSNPLKKISLSKYVLYVDLSETQIENISNLYKTEHLVLNNCNFIRNLPQSNNIKTIELIGTPIDKLYFYTNYELILTQLNLTKNISSKYKESNANIQIRKNLYLVISKGINIIDE
jgi:hypothetical protein